MCAPAGARAAPVEIVIFDGKCVAAICHPLRCFTDAPTHKPLCRLEAVTADKKEQARLAKEAL